MAATPAAETIYFGYGSNLWLHQMSQRCPESKYLGVGRLNGFRWNISPRGYANVIETGSHSSLVSDPAYDNLHRALHENNHDTSASPDGGNSADVLLKKEDSASDFVYGLVFSLTPNDERRLDKNENVPIAYTKEFIPTDFWSIPENAAKPEWTDVTKKPHSKTMLVYIDRQRTEDSEPKHEYIFR